jgi:hypothetical protein
MEEGIDRCKYFMRFLLEGKIIPSLRELRVRLASTHSHPSDWSLDWYPDLFVCDGDV